MGQRKKPKEPEEEFILYLKEIELSGCSPALFQALWRNQRRESGCIQTVSDGAL